MSARTFAEWQAYCAIEPFGPPADFWQAAMLASVIANANRTKNKKPFKPEDFMPKSMTQQDPTEQEVERLSFVISERFRAYNELTKTPGLHRE